MKRILFFLIVAISIFSQESILKIEETDGLIAGENKTVIKKLLEKKKQS